MNKLGQAVIKTLLTSSATALQGELFIPGDKSISHRSIMIGAIAEGVTEVNHFLNSADCLATMTAFQQMGVRIDTPFANQLIIHGVGLYNLQPSLRTIDCGNAGTAIRLLTGLLAAQTFDSHLTGDHSLQKRPMRRVIDPLTLMGAKITAKENEFCPLTIHGGANIQGIDYELPVASAQVKSALLLAGLYAKNRTSIKSSSITRDHTERMLQAFGANIHFDEHQVELIPGNQLTAKNITVPGDLSSAAFFIVAATLVPNSNIRLNNIGINPTRIGVVEILKKMGANIEFVNHRKFANEPVADIIIHSAKLNGIEVPESFIPLAIDELPILFIAAANAKGTTVFRGAKELRVKESDRLHSMAIGLQNLGIQVEELSDGLIINGGKMHGGIVDSFSDHRIAMAFAVAGQLCDESVQINDCENIMTSFPNFVELARRVGMVV